jgi:hypothetical protein
MEKDKIQAMDKLPFLQSGIAQVAMLVENLDQTVAAYWKHFGIGPWHFYTYGRPACQKDVVLRPSGGV